MIELGASNDERSEECEPEEVKWGKRGVLGKTTLTLNGGRAVSVCIEPLQFQYTII